MTLVVDRIKSRCRDCQREITETTVSEGVSVPRCPMLRCHECAFVEWVKMLTRRGERMVVTAPIRHERRILH